MWYVVLPQAMRIAIPPLGNQYLNLIKNSSLGAGIGYFELTNVDPDQRGQRLAGGALVHPPLAIYVGCRCSSRCSSTSPTAAFQLVER